jgi:hypothetical protein
MTQRKDVMRFIFCIDAEDMELLRRTQELDEEVSVAQLIRRTMRRYCKKRIDYEGCKKSVDTQV